MEDAEGPGEAKRARVDYGSVNRPFVGGVHYTEVCVGTSSFFSYLLIIPSFTSVSNIFHTRTSTCAFIFLERKQPTKR
jgi:hypothetical protein